MATVPPDAAGEGRAKSTRAGGPHRTAYASPQAPFPSRPVGPQIPPRGRSGAHGGARCTHGYPPRCAPPAGDAGRARTRVGGGRAGPRHRGAPAGRLVRSPPGWPHGHPAVRGPGAPLRPRAPGCRSGGSPGDAGAGGHRRDRRVRRDGRRPAGGQRRPHGRSADDVRARTAVRRRGGTGGARRTPGRAAARARGGPGRRLPALGCAPRGGLPRPPAAAPPTAGAATAVRRRGQPAGAAWIASEVGRRAFSTSRSRGRASNQATEQPSTTRARPAALLTSVRRSWSPSEFRLEPAPRSTVARITRRLRRCRRAWCAGAAPPWCAADRSGSRSLRAPGRCRPA